MTFPSGLQATVRQALLEALATEEGQQAAAEVGADAADAIQAEVSHPTLGDATIQL